MFLVLVNLSCSSTEEISDPIAQTKSAEINDLEPQEQSVELSLSTVENDEISFNTPQATLTSVPTLTPTPSQVATPTMETIPTTKNSAVLFKGPLVGFNIEGSDDFSLLLLDFDSLTFREIGGELIDSPLEIQWTSNGCELFILGKLIDLHGNIQEDITFLDRGSFAGTRLSPDKKRLAYPLFGGQQTLDGATLIDVVITNIENPIKEVQVSKNGGASSFSWSPNGQWLAFSDYDEQGILQIYRSTPDGKIIEQLTEHTEPYESIETISWSNDSLKIAYGVENFSDSVTEETVENYEGWVGLIELGELKPIVIRSPKLGFIIDIWWDEKSSRLAFSGSSLPFLSTDDPYRGRRIHWVDATTGKIESSFFDIDGPGGHFTVAVPVGNIDTFLISGLGGFYTLDGRTKSYDSLGNFELGGIIRGVQSSPFSFPGESNCSY